MEVEIEKLKSGEHPRKTFNDLDGLAHTIKEKGLINPIIVDEDFKIVCGERRFRAAKMVGLETVPVIVRKADEDERLELQLIDDAHDDSLPPLERANAWHKLKEVKSLGVEEFSELMGVHKTYVYTTLKLANVPKEIAFAFEKKQITMHELIKVRSLPEEKQLFALRQVISNPEKPKLNYMPKDVLRTKGVNVGPNVGVAGGKGESIKHFIIKCVIFKILKDMGRSVGCEVEVEGAVADVVDQDNRNVYEVETTVTPEKTKKKLQDFKSFNDVFIIEVPKVPNDVFEMEKYLKERII